MEPLMRKQCISAGAALIAAFTIFSFVQMLFSSALEKKETALQEQRSSLERLSKNLSQKDFYEEQWRQHQKLFEADAAGESLVNAWVKDLLSYASSEGIVFSKMEPQGVRKAGSRDKVRLYLSFQGGIAVLTDLVTHLIEKDPLSEIESLVVKGEGAPGRFTYELVLGKVMR